MRGLRMVGILLSTLTILAIVLFSNVDASVIVKQSISELRIAPPTTNIVRSIGVRDSYVFFTYVDSSNATGIAKFNPSDQSIALYRITEISPLSFLFLNFDFDAKGGVWFGTTDFSASSRLYKLDLDDGKVTSWPLDRFITGVCTENDASVWLTGGFLGRFNPVLGELKVYPLPAGYTFCFKPIFQYGKVWAILTQEGPLPGLSGNTLMVFDPSSETMEFFRLPLDEMVHDMTADNHGHLWLLSNNKLIEFNISSLGCIVIQSSYGGWGSSCDKDGNLYFVQRGYDTRLVKFSKDGSFTEYWKSTYPLSIQDVAVGGDDKAWFIETSCELGKVLLNIEGLFELSATGYEATSTTVFSTLSTSVEAVPSSSLTYTSGRSTSVATTSSIASAERVDSTLVATSSTTVTETKIVDEFPPYVVAAVLLSICTLILRGRKTTPRDVGHKL